MSVDRPNGIIAESTTNPTTTAADRMPEMQCRGKLEEVILCGRPRCAVPAVGAPLMIPFDSQAMSTTSKAERKREGSTVIVDRGPPEQRVTSERQFTILPKYVSIFSLSAKLKELN